VRLPEGWAQVDWIHRTLVSQPFTDATWRHIRSVTARRAGRAEHEEALARALDALLRRAATGAGTARERSVAARAGRGAAAAGAVHDVLQRAAPVVADGGHASVEEGEWDEDFEGEDMDCEMDGPAGGSEADSEGAGRRPVRRAGKIFDARVEAQQW
jgi:hypothetical protein